MEQKSIPKYWWLPVLFFFDFIFYYFIQYMVERNSEDLSVTIRLEPIIFLFLISLLSVACVHWVKKRMDRFVHTSIPFKYLWILFLSFILFMLISAGAQFLFEYLIGREHTLEYVIGNLILLAFLHTIVGNATIALAYFKESRQLLTHLLQAEKQQAENELRLLQQQMSPHFLFNNLNTLVSLIPQDTQKSLAFTKRLANVFRHVSKNARLDFISLQEELDFLKDYRTLLDDRFGNTIQWKEEIVPSDLAGIYIIPMSLQLLMENIIKHNVLDKQIPLKVHLKIKETTLEMRNDFRPKVADQTRTSGVGLTNLDSRYQLLLGQKIQFGREENSFVVRLPLTKQI